MKPLGLLRPARRGAFLLRIYIFTSFTSFCPFVSSTILLVVFRMATTQSPALSLYVIASFLGATATNKKNEQVCADLLRMWEEE